MPQPQSIRQACTLISLKHHRKHGDHTQGNWRSRLAGSASGDGRRARRIRRRARSSRHGGTRRIRSGARCRRHASTRGVGSGARGIRSRARRRIRSSTWSRRHASTRGIRSRATRRIRSSTRRCTGFVADRVHWAARARCRFFCARDGLVRRLGWAAGGVHEGRGCSGRRARGGVAHGGHGC